jgi:hypothetical protein
VPLQLVDGSAAEKKYAVTVRFPKTHEWFPLEYKYIIKDTTTNEVVSWEAIPGNRTLTLTRTTNVALCVLLCWWSSLDGNLTNAPSFLNLLQSKAIHAELHLYD